MGLESSFNFIDDLNSAWPLGSDAPSTLDNHDRGIKSAVQGSFPNLGSTAVTASAVELNIMDGVTATTAELNIMDGVTKTTTEINTSSALVQGTPVAATSGTEIDFTSIPSWVKKITIMLFEVGTSGTDDLILRVGDSGGVEVSGYNGTVAGVSTAGAGSGANATSYFPIGQIDSATNEANGNLTLCLQDDTNHNWCSNGLVAINGTSTDVFMSAGSKSIDTALTTVRISTVGGTDTFDNGSINIIYEG